VGELVGVGLGQALLGLVHLGGGPPVEEVGREGDVALVGQQVAHVAHVVRETPPGVEHEDPRAGAALREGEVAGAGVLRVHRL
jgi:hypothetical protein